MATCICGCKLEFEPKRSNQVYFSAEHREKAKRERLVQVWMGKDRARAWRTRQARQAAKTSRITQLLRESVQPGWKTVLWEKDGSFSRTRERGAKAVLKGRDSGILDRLG